MSKNERQITGSDSQDNYEAAVLDFLEREMTALEPTQSKNEQSDELDALVSDLLKQVIKESDQPNDDREAVPNEMDSLLSEFPPKQEEVSLPSSKTLESPVMAPTTSIDAKPIGSMEPAAKTSKSQPSATPAASIFTTPTASKRKIPMIAAAACLLAVIGIAVYYFSGSPKSVSNTARSQPYAAPPVAAVKQNQTAPTAVVPAAQAVLEKSTAAMHLSGPASTISVQKPSAPAAVTQPADTQQSTKPSTAKSEPPPAPTAVTPSAPTPPKEEKPAAVSSAVPDKPAPPAMPQNTVPANAAVEISPAQPAPVAPPSAENSAPTAQPHVPAPVVPRNLVPSVPISQTRPVYPELALRTHTSATIILDVQIDEQGNVVKATPVSGPALFYNAAISAVMKWRYKPASIGGTNVGSQSRVTLNFNLKK